MGDEILFGNDNKILPDTLSRGVEGSLHIQHMHTAVLLFIALVHVACVSLRAYACVDVCACVLANDYNISPYIDPRAGVVNKPSGATYFPCYFHILRYVTQNMTTTRIIPSSINFASGAALRLLHFILDRVWFYIYTLYSVHTIED